MERWFRAPDTVDLAWAIVLPWAFVSLLIVVGLGPPLGHALFSHGSDALWPASWWEAQGHPEPAKHGRYVLAMLVSTLLAAGIWMGVRRNPRPGSVAVRTVALAVQVMLLAVVAVALLEQQPALNEATSAPAIFGLGTCIAALMMVGAAITALGSVRVTRRIAAFGRETASRRFATLAVATGFVAIWLLKAVTTDKLAAGRLGLNLPWTLNDSVAVLDGRTPLVDYHPIYAKLLPYLTAPVLAAFGTTAFAYSVFMAFLSGLALLTVYAVLRLVTRNSLFALGLFLPFVATSDLDVPVHGSPMTMSSMWPMRYGGAYLLAWLTARHVAGNRSRRAWIIFFVGGLVALNNLEFGGAAMLASGAALLSARPARSPHWVSRLAVDLAGGVAGAVAVVALVTVVRSGDLPHFDMLMEWPQIFTALGWFSMPLRTWDLHLAFYATFVASIAVASMRLASRHEDTLLTGMLVWSGVFGLLAGGYFVGRPDVVKFTGMLSAWSFALCMLMIVCLRALASRSWRRPTLSQLLVLFGFALSLCSLRQISSPHEQIARLRNARSEPTYLHTAKQFVREQARPGERVAVLLPMSYQISHSLGVRNVAPYSFMNSIVTVSQMNNLLDVVRRERVVAIFVPAPESGLDGEGDSAPAQLQALVAIGFAPTASAAGMIALRKVS
jgi:hypothetical protein